MIKTNKKNHTKELKKFKKRQSEERAALLHHLVPNLLQSWSSLCHCPSPSFLSRESAVNSVLPVQGSSSVDLVERTLNLEQTPFFRFEINSKEKVILFPERPVLGVGYVPKLCPDAFPDVPGLRVCVVCVHVCEDV